jgi:rhodanese-related sulfurtransferase
MGPFVPEPISEQLNLVVALLLGLGFGFVLEQAGFSSSRRLAGVFYGYDFTVLRVFFTAAVTAMSGVILLGYFGLLDTELIFVNPLWLWPAIVGGIIMGLGFILGGYCPGTSVCAAAIGKVDAMFFVIGGLLGVLVFGELFPLYKGFFASSALGPVKVFQSLGISQGLFAFLLIAMAVGAFSVTTRIEKKVDPEGAPSLAFPGFKHKAAGLGVLALGVVFIFLPDYKTRLIRRVANPGFAIANPAKEMTVDELAFRIVDQEPQIKILDLRSPGAFAKVPLPGSVNLAQNDLFSREWSSLLSQRRVKKVLVAEDEASERTAFLLAQQLGYENFVILKGGFPAFDRTILNPGVYAPKGNRWDGDVRSFRENAKVQLQKMIADNKTPANKAPKKEKAIQGGC